MLLDLPSRQEIEALAVKLDKLLTHVASQAGPAASELLTLDQVAAYTQFDRRTVRQWVAKGQFDRAGKRIYLPALKYGDLLRFRVADVEAFGLGTGVLTPAVGGGPPQPTKQAKAAPQKRLPVPSETALKVA